MCYFLTDDDLIVPEEEGKYNFVYSVFDGMVFDIELFKSNRSKRSKSISAYEEVSSVCKEKEGNLISVDSQSKLASLVTLIKKHKDKYDVENANYLIGKLYRVIRKDLTIIHIGLWMKASGTIVL